MYPHDFETPCLLHPQGLDELQEFMNWGGSANYHGVKFQFVDHPLHGELTAVKAGKFWLVFKGEFIDAVDDTMPLRLYPSTKLVNMNDARGGVEPYL